ncbi:MAG: GC-type dockerin domain-anchored protein [Planctomycetota bacterium]
MNTHRSHRTLCTWAAAGLAMAATVAPVLGEGRLGPRASRTATATASGHATAPAAEIDKKRAVTRDSIMWSQIAHEYRHHLSAERLAEIKADRARPLAVRAREQAERMLDPDRRVEWRLPKRPMTSGAAKQTRTASLSNPGTDAVQPAEADMPGGVFVPRAWPIIATPQGPELQVPYTFSEEIIEGFFVNPDPESPEGFNILNSIPNILAIQLILETDLLDIPVDLNGDGVITEDPANPGFDELIPLKFVGYNPLIHEQAIVYGNQGLDPDLVAAFVAQPDVTPTATADFNSIDGFGAPSLQDPAGAFSFFGTLGPIGGDDVFNLEFAGPGVAERPNNLTASRGILHNSWSNVGELSRQIAFALGLTWQQTRTDRDTFIEVFPESILPTDDVDSLVTQVLIQFNDSPNVAATGIQFGSLTPPSGGSPTDPLLVRPPESFRTFGQYDAFSLVHQDAFTLSINGLPTFAPLPAILETAAIAMENQRRLDDNDPATEVIPGSPAALSDSDPTNDTVQAGLDELLFLVGFTPEFSAGDIATLGRQLSLNPFFPGQNPKCPADFDGDGDQDFEDLLGFANMAFPEDLDAMSADELAARAALDMNLTGQIEPADYTLFFTLYASGECFEDFDPNPADVPFIEPDSCNLDVNGDGELNFFDRIEFETLFLAGNPVADLAADGILDEQDLLAFDDAQLAGTCRPNQAPLANGCPFDITGPADLDGDGVNDPDGEQDWLDLLFFAELVAAGAPGADFNGDLERNFIDFNNFETAFEIGSCQPGVPAPISSGCDFDVNVDGKLDWLDRIAYAELFDPTNPAGLAADANNNGVVGDPDDFGVFDIDGGVFAAFGQCQLGTGADDPIPDGCGFDVNGDGVQTFIDRSAFGDLFAAGSPAADLNGDSFIDELDFEAFNNAFETGECVPGTPQDDGPLDDGCPLDLDNNGVQDFNDILLFVQLWNAGNPAADFDSNGFIEIEDLQEFNSQFVPGFCSPITPFPEPDNRPGTSNPILPG